MALVTAIHLRGTRAAQPAASSANAGYIYCVTDESNILERSSGSAWQAYSPSGAGSGTVTNTGALASGAIVKGNGGVDVSTTTTGTGVLTALGVNTGSAGAFVVNGGALGTPSSGTLSSCTGLPASALATISSIYINVQDQKTQNTAGGTFTSGAWQTRTLNTEVSDVGNLCSLASNQMTLSAGTYIVHATAPAYLAGSRHQARLQNVTDATTLVLGTSIYAPTISANTVVTQSVVRGIFTVGASKALELQHQCQATEASDGFGVAANFTTEVYSVVELWKIG